MGVRTLCLKQGSVGDDWRCSRLNSKVCHGKVLFRKSSSHPFAVIDEQITISGAFVSLL